MLGAVLFCGVLCIFHERQNMLTQRRTGGWRFGVFRGESQFIAVRRTSFPLPLYAPRRGYRVKIR